MGKSKLQSYSICGGKYGGIYERKKCENDKKIEINNSGNGSGVDNFDGVWHTLCNKGCGWN